MRGRDLHPDARGFAYLVAVMDWKTRAVLSWKLSNTLDATFCLAALREALDGAGGAPEIFNTGQGSQFTNRAWIEALENAGVKGEHGWQRPQLPEVLCRRLQIRILVNLLQGYGDRIAHGEFSGLKSPDRFLRRFDGATFLGCSGFRHALELCPKSFP